MLEMFTDWRNWLTGKSNPEPAKNIKDESPSQECFTYVYSTRRGESINLDAYFKGEMNASYLKQISANDGREDVTKCKLFSSRDKLMKMLSSQHAPPPTDLYILRLEGNSDKVVETIKQNQFDTTIVEAINYMDLWRQQNIDPNAPVLIVPNPYKDSAKQYQCIKSRS